MAEREPAREATGHAAEASGYHVIAGILGPMPRDSLRAMVDYGLNDAEIARHYGLSRTTIAKLRRDWRIDGPSGRLVDLGQ